MRLTAHLHHGRRLAAIALLLQLSASSSHSQGQPSVITLAWDANADEVAGYRVHVGTRSGDYGESYDVGDSTMFSYGMAVQGRRYYFAVAAYAADGRSSPLSSEVSAVAPAPGRPPGEDAPEVPEGESLRQDRSVERALDLHAECTAGTCYDVREIAADLASVSALETADDATVLWVEEGRAVRMLPPGARGSRTVLAAQPASRITEVAPSPGFATDPRIFVGVVYEPPGAAPQFSVIRYRLFYGSLIEPLVAVSRIPLAAGGEPRLAVDAGDRVYLAMPGEPSSRDPYAGRILRFNADGTVPGENRAASPVLAVGFPSPLRLRVDEAQLWAAGTTDGASHALGRLALDRLSSGDWPAALTAATSARGGRVRSAAIEGADASTDEGRLFAFVDGDDGELVLLRLDRASEMRVNLRRAGAPLVPELVSVARGRLFVAARGVDGTVGVFELTPVR